jgi:hypothetical protein
VRIATTGPSVLGHLAWLAVVTYAVITVYLVVMKVKMDRDSESGCGGLMLDTGEDRLEAEWARNIATELARYPIRAPSLDLPPQEFADGYDDEVSIAMTGSTAKGSLDASTIERSTKRSRHALERCYRRALLDDTELRAQLTIRFVVEANGRVGRMASAGEPADLAQCVASAIRAIRFPGGKRSTAVVYPFGFAPQ